MKDLVAATCYKIVKSGTSEGINCKMSDLKLVCKSIGVKPAKTSVVFK